MATYVTLIKWTDQGRKEVGSLPDRIDAGLRVGRLGSSSVRYEIGLFRAGDEAPVAAGHFVHVFVARDGRRPTPIPEPLRSALARLVKS